MNKKYYIYHIEGVKIGVSTQPKIRVRNQKFTEYKILEEHTDIYEVSNREKELQTQYGYKVDSSYYWETIKAQKHIPNKARVKGGKRAAKVNGNKQGLINAKNGHMERMRKRTIEVCSIPIVQYDKDGSFIREWDSGAMAARELGLDKSSIMRVCKGKQLTSGGFVFKYKSDIEC
jgi:hypothetical protein